VPAGDFFAHPTFQRLPEYYALSLLPGEGVFDARNDSIAGWMSRLAGGRPESGLYQWLWETTEPRSLF
jgi:hypothetical protein